MTHLCEIITFRPRGHAKSGNSAPNRKALATLQEAERLVDLASDSVQAGICNAGAGIVTSRLGAVSEGQTLMLALRFCLKLMELRSNPADSILKRAIEEWLYQRGNGNA